MQDEALGHATTMNDLHASLALLFAELTDGAPPDAAYMLNPGDAGLLRSLDALSAEAASKWTRAPLASRPMWTTSVTGST